MTNYCNCGGKKIRNYKVLLLVDLRFNSPSIRLIGQPVKTRRGDKVVRCAVHAKLNICACSESRAGVMPRKSLPASPSPPVFSLVNRNVWVSRIKSARNSKRARKLRCVLSLLASSRWVCKEGHPWLTSQQNVSGGLDDWLRAQFFF